METTSSKQISILRTEVAPSLQYWLAVAHRRKAIFHTITKFKPSSSSSYGSSSSSSSTSSSSSSSGGGAVNLGTGIWNSIGLIAENGNGHKNYDGADTGKGKGAEPLWSSEEYESLDLDKFLSDIGFEPQ